ncbi:MAG TPA: calcium-binding protein [Actinomycetes bacterium]|nr:calcium-binding protein [Actinomycetes bacterium]
MRRHLDHFLTVSFTVLAVGVATVSVGTPAASAADSELCWNTPATIVGTEGDDVIDGTSGNDVVVGLGGNDVINGFGGEDFLCGGEGSDQLVGGDDDDYLNTGANATLPSGYPVPEDMWGGAGDDDLRGGPMGFDRVHYEDVPNPVVVDLGYSGYLGNATGEGKDHLYNINVVYGTDYNDFLTGIDKADPDHSDEATAFFPIDRLYGLGGDDHLSGLAGRDELIGGDGDDWVEGGDDRDGIHGGPGADTLLGGAGPDFIDGDAGNDAVAGNEDADSLDGGVGDDTVLGGGQWDSLSDPSGVDVADGGADSDDCTLSFETAISCDTSFDDGNPPQATRITGAQAPSNAVTSAALARRLPVLNTTDAARTDATERCQGVRATIVGTNNGEIIEGTKRRDVIVAGKGPDLIKGMGGDDLICGEKGGDLIYGGDGDDDLFGGTDGYNPGAEDDDPDEFWGGAGNDSFDVGEQSSYLDPVHYNDATQAIEVKNDVALGQGRDQLVNVSLVVGSEFDDVMSGGDEFRWFIGGGGDDTLRGGASRDVLEGGEGNDVLAGAGGNDSLEGQGGDDEVSAGDGADYIEVDAGSDHVTGGFGDDAMVVFAGDSLLEGGPGDDSFFGGSGQDTVIGGPQLAGDVCYQFLEATSGCEFQRFSRYHQL